MWFGYGSRTIRFPLYTGVSSFDLTTSARLFSRATKWPIQREMAKSSLARGHMVGAASHPRGRIRLDLSSAGAPQPNRCSFRAERPPLSPHTSPAAPRPVSSPPNCVGGTTKVRRETANRPRNAFKTPSHTRPTEAPGHPAPPREGLCGAAGGVRGPRVCLGRGGGALGPHPQRPQAIRIAVLWEAGPSLRHPPGPGRPEHSQGSGGCRRDRGNALPSHANCGTRFWMRNATSVTPPPLSKLRESTELIRSPRLLSLSQGRSLRATHPTTGTHAPTKIMHKYPQNQSSVGSSGQTLTTNVSMIPCDWQNRHQTHDLCGGTTFRTESN